MNIATETRTVSAPFSLKPLMFETFVCTMTLMAFVALAGPIARVIGLAAWQMGIAVAVAGFAWMLMSRIWGVWSDKRGRRPVILFGLTCFAFSYALHALFLDLAMKAAMAPFLAFIGIVLGRGLAGLFYAAVPATSAALVADHVPADKRASAMAAIGASSAAGMMIGPSVAGLLGPIDLSLPLYMIAVLPFIALAVLWKVLPRQDIPAPSDHPAPRITDPRLRKSMIVAFAAAFSVAVAQIIVGFFALDRLHLDPGAAAYASGMALAIVGVALICAQIFLRKLGWPPEKLIRVGGILGALGFASVIFATSTPMLWASYAVAAFGMGWVYPSVSALAANSVEAHEQGAAAGSVAAAQGLGVVVGPIISTASYAFDQGFPYLLIAILLAGTVLRPDRNRTGRADCGCA
ncbi:MFS transporter [Altericroceibacterium endophyticum]|uniref:MFS transporter n=1 Tax=Altericroceibacterium endophyticum TaxID=1808508 RepID=A0A6I4T7X4_9SPHN|nr:MFS transporter [Altericroceibacterium endophyticum]MXO65895.1 MFS transporter [Altericroceibacterium endophyticum]